MLEPSLDFRNGSTADLTPASKSDLSELRLGGPFELGSGFDKSLQFNNKTSGGWGRARTADLWVMNPPL